MKNLAAIALGAMFLVLAMLIAVPQSLAELGSIDGFESTTGNEPVVLAHGSHSDCQKDPNGRNHKHRFKDNKKISCH